MKHVIKIIAVFLIIFSFFFLPQETFAVITFSISDPQYQDEEIIAQVSITGLTSSSCPNVSCYLQGGFTKTTGNPRYFGFTKNHVGNWYEYISSPDTNYIQSTFFAFQSTEGSWSGALVLKANPDDPDYEGPGDYSLKLWRYTGNSSSGLPSDNTILVSIATSTPTPTPTSTPTPASIKTPTPAKSPTPTKTPTPTLTKTSTPTVAEKAVTISAVLNDILGESTQSAVVIEGTTSPIVEKSKTAKEKETKVMGENNSAKLLISIGIVFLLACGILAFRAYRKRRNEIKNL